MATSGSRNPLLEAHRFLRRGPVNEEGWSQLVAKDRSWERSYRGRWAHDQFVRTTHGVNCTGSCSWNIYVKDGLITWRRRRSTTPPRGRRCPTTSRADPGWGRTASATSNSSSPIAEVVL